MKTLWHCLACVGWIAFATSRHRGWDVTVVMAWVLAAWALYLAITARNER